MRKIFSKTCGLVTVLACMSGPAFAQTTDLGGENAIIITPNSTSSTVNQQGFNLPTAPRATGQDIIRGSGGISCQSAIGGNGPTLDLGVIGSNDVFDRDSAALYGRITMQLGKKSKRVDCNRLYDLEVERLKMELALLRAGTVGAGGGGGGYGDTDAVRSILAQGQQQGYQAPVRTVEADEDDLPESASISPFRLGGPQKAKSAEPAPAPKAAEAPVVPAPKPMETRSVTAKSAAATKAQAPAIAMTAPGLSAFYTYDNSEKDESETVTNKIPALAVALAKIGDEEVEHQGPTYFAQMGAFSTLEKAQAAWTEYSADVPSNLPEGVAFANPVVRGDKTLYLLQAGPYSKTVGRKICKSLKTGCFAVRT